MSLSYRVSKSSDRRNSREPSGSTASEASPEHDDEDEPDNGTPHRQLTTNDLFIKDAFLVFRALCKLTMKPLNSERLVFVAHISGLVLIILVASAI